MKFNDEIVAFDFADIPLIGNLCTGYVIGLTEAGAAVCTRLLHEDVPEGDIVSVDKALYDHLVLGGFFESGDASSSDGQVLSAYLHVTQRCNLSCVGCYSLDEQRNVLDDAPFDDIAHAIDQLAASGVTRLVISGGEPFLRFDLPHIVAHAKAVCGIQSVTVLSNGTCLKEEVLAKLAPYVDCVSVSFDGCSASSPAYIRQEQRYEELVDAVRTIRTAGIQAHIISTVHAKNTDDMAAYVSLSKKLGATLNFSLLTCEPHDPHLGGLLPDDAALRKLGKSLLTLDGGKPIALMDAPIGLNLTVKSNCGAGFKAVSVAADGTVYPCHMLQRSNLAMGNVFTGTMAAALESDVSNMFRALDAAMFDDCGPCHYVRICGGGCRARSLFASGNLESKDSYCAMTQEFYDNLGVVMNAGIDQMEGR